jgi:hypothetical protein
VEERAVTIEQVVREFLDALGSQPGRQARFPFKSEERRNWHYIPRAHNGVLLKAMNAAQRQAAMAVLRAALSERGYARAEDIMWLETVLAAIEHDPATYDPLHYALTVFGDPGGEGPWGWRIDGHHLSLNFTHLRQQVTVTPAFFGAHPAAGRAWRKGGLARSRHRGGSRPALMHSLDDEQRRAALIAAEAFADIITGPGREDSLRRPSGLAFAAMAEPQRHLIMRLIEEFVGAIRPATAEAERARIRATGLEQIHFAWAGSLEPRRPHYYRLHGPAVLIEYDNTQNDANHIHSVWHNPGRDFADDLLRRHYQERPHHAAAPATAEPRPWLPIGRDPVCDIRVSNRPYGFLTVASLI